MASTTPLSQLAPISAGFVPFARDQIEQSISARFESQVREHRNRIAVLTPTETWTYAELNQFANRIARAVLARRGPGSESIVLYLEKGPVFLAAMLGVLKAGK